MILSASSGAHPLAVKEHQRNDGTRLGGFDAKSFLELFTRFADCPTKGKIAMFGGGTHDRDAAVSGGDTDAAVLAMGDDFVIQHMHFPGRTGQ